LLSAVAVGEQSPDEGQQVLHYGGVEEIINLLSLSPRGDQVRLLEHGEMMRHRWFRHVEVLRQFARRLLAAAQEAQHLSTSRVRQRLKSIVHVHGWQPPD